MITRENYEIYFIDYFDGNLSVEVTAKLLLFLEQNLDLKQEFDSFQNLNISEVFDTNSELNSVDFSNLKKENSINSKNEEDYFIGYIENDLSEEEKQSLSLYISDNKENKAKLERFKNTKLTVPFIPFPDKKSLKKSNTKVIYFYASLFAAACILAFILIPFFNTNSPNGFENTPVFVEQIPTEIIPKNTVDSIPKMKIIEQKNSFEIKQKQKKNEEKFIARVISPPIKTNSILPTRENKILIERYNLKVLDFPIANNEIQSYIPVKTEKLPEIIEDYSKINNSYTLLGFAKLKANNFLKKKTGYTVNSSKDILAIASLETQEIAKKKSLYTKKEDTKYIYKSLKIGRLIKIYWKTKK